MDRESGQAGAWALGIIVAVLLIAGLAIGGWQLGWWMQSYSASRSATIYQQSYGAQTADIQQVQQAMTDVASINVQMEDPSTPASEDQSLQAQKQAVINQACSVGIKINPTDLPSQEASFMAQNCGGVQ